MQSIDPKMTVTEILKMYPETLSVFRSFNMKCAEDNSYAEKTLEDNLIVEQISFIDVFSELDKKVRVKTQKQDIKPLLNKYEGTGKNHSKNENLLNLHANEISYLRSVSYEWSGNENFIKVGHQVSMDMSELRTINGTGKKFFGKFDRTGTDKKTYRTILFFVFLWFPILPLGCYRVKSTGTWAEKSWIIYAEEKLLAVECLTVYIMRMFNIMSFWFYMLIACLGYFLKWWG
jgi:hypothetical protein